MKIETAIFDFDGTLGDSQECIIASTKSAFEKAGLTIPSNETIKYYIGIPLEKSLKEMADRELQPEELEGLLKEFRKVMLEIEKGCLKIFPGIIEMLESLKEKKISCFVVSSKKQEVLLRNIKILGIEDYFIEITGPDNLKNYKPHPEGIDVLVEKYNFDRQKAIMIGDAVFDIQMGKAARLNTCAVTWGTHSKEDLEQEKPDILIHSPMELALHIE